MKTLYIAIMFIVLLTFGIFQAPIIAQQSQQNSSALPYQECQNKIGSEMQKIVDSINKTKAILLAINSNEFQSKINGYRYVYSDIFTNMTEDQNVCGDVKLTSIVIEFSILNGSSNFVKFIQVGEDPQISQVTLVEDVFISNCDNSCPPPSPPAGNIQKPLTSPLRQIASGVSPKDVKCRQDLILIFRTEDNFPACVKPDTISKLIERGWAKMILVKTGIAINSYTPISNETENQTVKIVAIKMVPPYTPGGPVIQLTIQNVGTTPITNLNAILETNHNYTFNFKSITSSTPLISGNSRSDTTMLIGGGFQTESTYSLIISGMKYNMPFEYLEKVRIQG